jgi:hypothetical protein
VGVGGWQGTWPFGLTMDAMMIMGAYFGMLLVLLYTGRQYYTAVFRRAFGFPAAEPVESSAIWGARFFMLGMTFFTVYCALNVGLDWPIALLFGLGCVAVYLVMGRLLAETGLFFIVVDRHARDAVVGVLRRARAGSGNPVPDVHAVRWSCSTTRARP